MSPVSLFWNAVQRESDRVRPPRPRCALRCCHRLAGPLRDAQRVLERTPRLASTRLMTRLGRRLPLAHRWPHRLPGAQCGGQPDTKVTAQHGASRIDTRHTDDTDSK
jgi:hypothetical protein